jgi:prephenate dehydrogenase
MTPEPPFRSIAIAGLGLIGGSLALATREHWPSVRVIGVDSASVLAHASGNGAIDRSAPSLRDVDDVGLIVLAAPVKQNIELLRDVPSGMPVVVTDVGSTKQAMVEAGRGLASPAVFVGGHPLGGAERGGFAFARPDLFHGRPWIFTPDDGSEQAESALSVFVAGLGARPVTMPAPDHDRLMAFVSHLPQLTASVLMDVVGAASGADGLRLAGRGLIDTTRLAASPADVWRDVCQTNPAAIGDALDRLIDRLTRLRNGLEREGEVDELFDASARWRHVLMKGRE